MTQGYIALGIDCPGKTDNLKAAATLAMTAKIADPTREFAVIVRNIHDIPSTYDECFDYIIELPFGQSVEANGDQQIDFWQVFYATPFDDTIWFNTRTLVVDTLESLWEGTEHFDLLFGTAHDFRQARARYQKKFTPQRKNNVLEFTTDMIYFGQNETAAEFFKMADPVLRNWRDVCQEMLIDNRPDKFDFTIMVNIIATMIGYTQPSSDINFVYTDLDPDNLPVESHEETDTDWTEQINIWFYKGQHVKVNNHRQSGVFVYHDDDILTDESRNEIRTTYSNTQAEAAA
jgi:hypothetical protein